MHRRTFLAASVAALAAPPSPPAAHFDLVQVLLPSTSPAATGQALDIDELRDRTAGRTPDVLHVRLHGSGTDAAGPDHRPAPCRRRPHPARRRRPGCAAPPRTRRR
ncbi:hypothetical protein ACRAWF_44925 [Streptomyces sp. L7]